MAFLISNSGRTTTRTVPAMELLPALLLSVVFLSFVLRAGSCPPENIPVFQDTSRDELAGPVQAIVPTYTFTCHGNITLWGACVQPGGGNEVYDILFQVFRPTPVGGRCYDEVGRNFLNDGRPGSGGNVDHCVVLADIQPEDQIQVQPGDVVGFFAIQYNNANTGQRDGGVQLNLAINNVTVWNTAIVSMNSPDMCPYHIGGDGNLASSSTGAPVITAQVAPFTPSSPIASLAPSSVPSFSPTPSPSASSIGETSQPQPPRASVLPTVPDSNPDSSDSLPVGVIIGIIIALLALIVIVILAIIIVLAVRLKLLSRKENITQPNQNLNGLSNPNYEVSSVKPRPKPVKVKPKPKPKKPAQQGEADYQLVKQAVYEYPSITRKNGNHPPPQKKEMYTYVSPNEAGKAGTHVYHVVNRPSEEHYEDPNAVPPGRSHVYHTLQSSTAHYEDPNAPPGNNLTLGSSTAYYEDPNAPPHTHYEDPNAPPGNNHMYHTLGSSTVHYDDPEVPSFQESSMDIYDSAGIYVPTQEQRTAAGNRYEMLENEQYSKLKFFSEDRTYWAPASTTTGLYEQLAAKRYREIPRYQIQLKEQLGSGQFGRVCKGLWRFTAVTMEVAVKTLKPRAPDSQKVKFLQEAAIMGQFSSHPNVVKLFGVVTMGEPTMIVLEIMPNGDLRSYTKDMDLDRYKDKHVLQCQFLKFGRDIASGMGFLARKAFVHRDLAARNILLDQNLNCKIGDFGMARDLMDDTYYKSTGGQVPVKWTAPEALLYKKYSPHSDVWSYGMVLFEIWSVGRKPFQNLSNNDVIALVNTGHCQPPPPGCPRAVYKLMVQCWNPNHQQRPSFDDISDYLKQPEEKLLYWAEEDAAVSQNAAVLGAPIMEARRLYLDLQYVYKDGRVV